MYSETNPRLSPLIPSQKISCDFTLLKDEFYRKLLSDCFTNYLLRLVVDNQNSQIFHINFLKVDALTSIPMSIDDAENEIISLAHHVSEKKDMMPHSLIRQATFVGQRGRRGTATGMLINEKTFNECNWKKDIKKKDEEIIIGKWKQVIEPFLNIKIWFGDVPDDTIVLFYNLNDSDGCALLLSDDFGNTALNIPPGKIPNIVSDYVTVLTLI